MKRYGEDDPRSFSGLGRQIITYFPGTCLTFFMMIVLPYCKSSPQVKKGHPFYTVEQFFKEKFNRTAKDYELYSPCESCVPGNQSSEAIKDKEDETPVVVYRRNSSETRENKAPKRRVVYYREGKPAPQQSLFPSSPF